ncbi:phosphotransferase [Bifidobacterium miconisargentati]|uniref:phosphotransferase n=1 Tax=Bifidobacterium miconisargentati TaxID=2834437 RepID=UPI001BDC9D90|nr:phosphotransferase [Bifidobacterium miconisargentati]MBW3090922.1 phosphotransferase [Bifidobacterium miconisargentati]
MNTDLIETIALKEKHGAAYYDLHNSAGKRWLIRDSFVRTAFGLYQPTALKGKAVKFAFPLIHHSPAICRALGFVRANYSLVPGIRMLFSDLFGGPVDCSFFGGTPGAHQKVVMQISRGPQVLAYCKATDNPEVAALFEREAGNLLYLHDHGVNRVPKALYCGQIGGLTLFCQTNVSDVKRTTTILTARHRAFLTDLHTRTVQRMRFEDTDYYEKLRHLQGVIQRISDADERDVVRKAVDFVIGRYEGEEVDFGFHHGDFTPWNIADTPEGIAVFDFEYAKRTYPPYLDACHFYMQTQFFVHKRRDMRRILDDYMGDKHVEKLLHGDRLWCMLLYLLAVIDLYLSRGHENEDEMELRTCRIDMLKEVMRRYADKD